jgi:hypothetical protein
MQAPAQLALNAKLPAHALFTSHLTVEPITGTALEHGTVELPGDDRAWMAAIYKGVHPDTGLNAEYKASLKSSKGDLWEKACAIEFGRLAQGNLPPMIRGTNTMHFIHRSDMPDDR